MFAFACWTSCSLPTRRCVLCEAEVRSVLMIVAHIFRNQPLQMTLIEDDHVIQQVSSAASHPTLGHSVLPGTAICGAHGFTPHCFGGADHIVAKLRIAIQQQEGVSRRVRPRLPQLLHDPESLGISCHVKTQNPAPVVTDDEKTVQHPKRKRRYSEEIHGRDGLTMVAKKGEPALANLRASGRSPQPARDGGLGD